MWLFHFILAFRQCPMARNSFSDEPMACVPRGWRSNGPGRQAKRGAQGRQALFTQQRPPAGRQANSARAGRNELEESNKKNKSSPQLLLLHQPSPLPSWGQGFPPAKAVCSSFPEGNGDLNHEWCVYALKFWENATMTGACLVGNSLARRVYGDPRGCHWCCYDVKPRAPGQHRSYVTITGICPEGRPSVCVCAPPLLPCYLMSHWMAMWYSLNIDPTYMH